MSVKSGLNIAPRLLLGFGAMGLIVVGLTAAMANTLVQFEDQAFRALEITRSTNTAPEIAAAVKAMHATVSGSVYDAILTSLGALLLGGLIAWLLARGIVRATSRLTAAMDSISAGNLKTEVPELERGDEFGSMARALSVFKENAAENERLRAEGSRRDAEQAAARKAELKELANRFEAATGGVIRAIRDASSSMQGKSDDVAGMAEDTLRQARAVMEAAQAANSNVQSVGAATEQLNASTQEIAAQVARANQVAKEAGEAAARSTTLVGALSQNSAKIDEVISLISSIAAQTNLLALNATIEAARAGEAGKGFAVVAGEVKALANQTGKATDEISSQIEAMRSSIGETVEAMSAIDQTVRRIAEANMAISGAVEEQAATTADISRNLDDAVEGVGRVAGAIAEVSKAADNTGEASGAMSARSRDLDTQARALYSSVEDFLAGLRRNDI